MRKFDERVDSWMHRIDRRALTYGAFEGLAVLPENAIFDAENMALLAARPSSTPGRPASA